MLPPRPFSKPRNEKEKSSSPLSVSALLSLGGFPLTGLTLTCITTLHSPSLSWFKRGIKLSAYELYFFSILHLITPRLHWRKYNLCVYQGSPSVCCSCLSVPGRRCGVLSVQYNFWHKLLVCQYALDLDWCACALVQGSTWVHVFFRVSLWVALL